MWIELPAISIVLLNVLGIPSVHLLLSWGVTHLSASRFRPEGLLYRSRAFEAGGRFYERVFLLRRWKGLLPDAAPWFSGFSKKSLLSTDPAYLARFRVETCRGEFAHWAQLCVISSFVLWNPFPANVVIILYAVISNLPCIITQRHTRLRLGRVIERGVLGGT